MTSDRFFITTSIVSTLGISILFIKKDKYRRLMSFFIVIFILGQVIGYGMDIDFLKVNIPQGDYGTSYSLASTAIPLALAAFIDYIYKRFKK